MASLSLLVGTTVYSLIILPGDSLIPYHNGQAFTTNDQDNDKYSINCAEKYHGAWWYRDCHESNLNGGYLNGTHSSYADGMNWETWRGYKYSYKTSKMMIRRILPGNHEALSGVLGNRGKIPRCMVVYSMSSV